jgi:TatD DNase family protein
VWRAKCKNITASEPLWPYRNFYSVVAILETFFNPSPTRQQTPTWVDTHCHFDFEDFDPDRGELWQSCRDLGVKAMVIPGVAPDQWPRMAHLCPPLPGIYFGVGLHPCWLHTYLDGEIWRDPLSRQNRLQQLQDSIVAAAAAPACVAIGECGLDQFIDGDPEQQEAVLRCHLLTAAELDMPVVLHCRRAHNDLMRLLKQHPVPRGGVLHAFSGSSELARQYWAMGFFLGVGGTITYERANKTRNAIKELPLEALVLETDAPDMPLYGRQGRRNSPDQIPVIAAALAQLRGESVEVIARQTTLNAQRLFRFDVL